MHIYLIAGEASGDFLGAQLMKAFKGLGRPVKFSGLGGALMEAEGLQSLFPMQDISLLGLAEILPKIPQCLRRIRQTAADIQNQNPDVVITIDSPDFCHRVTKALKKAGSSIPCVHYVAPTVWAWRPGRAKKIAKHLDLLLTLFPFEPPYFELHGLKTVFVGHPIAEVTLPTPAPFKGESLCILPGSRVGEITKLLPLFVKVALKLKAERPHLRLLLPTLPHLRPLVEKVLGENRTDFEITDSVEQKWHAFQNTTAAIAASGTVSLELAKTQTPHLIAYRVNSLTHLIGCMLIKTPYVGLVNILLQKPVVPELLQNDCTFENLLSHGRELLDNGQTQKPPLQEAYELLQPPTGGNVSSVAVQAILAVI